MVKIVDLILIVILILLVFVGYKVYQIIPGENVPFDVFIPENNLSLNDATEELSMFLPNMRFNTNNLSYYIDSCNAEKKENIIEAFRILSEETGVLNFYETYQGFEATQIVVYCSVEKQEPRNNSFVVGEGGPDRILNLSLYPLITSGKVYLYKTQSLRCDYPSVEIHELLHVFGFNHLKNEKDILYPYADCEQRISEETINKLKYLYSFDAKADIQISNISVSKAGSYLNFEIEIYNRGLIGSEDVILDIYDIAKNKRIGNFSFNELEPGTSKTLNIKNLFLNSRNINSIKFVIGSDTPEFFYENNEVVAMLEQ